MHLSSFLTRKRGFTLIELLVTIAIISILSGVIYASFSQARAVARDEVRKTSLKEMQLAIELYKAQYGRYPEGCKGPNQWGGSPGSTTWACPSNSSEYIVGLAPGFIDELPVDPHTGGSKSYIYRTNPAGTDYKLMAHGTPEVKLIKSYDDEFARCSRQYATGSCTADRPHEHMYAVYSAGADSW